MTEEMNLKQIKKNAYISYHQDGLIDIMIGIWILIVVLCLLFEIIWLSGIIIITLGLIYMGTKQKFTIPRIGYVKFDTRRSNWIYTIFVIVFCLGFLGIIIAITNLEGFNEWMDVIIGSYYKLIIAGIGGSLTLLIAIRGVKRFYIHTALILIVYILAQLFSAEFLFSTSIIGVFFITLGVITLIHFLHKYPLHPKEIANGLQ